mmetsp:Transcript_4496/g.7915  ORF Transcript_4496/g.7915 Transcript_4496/m.7915 type:complete len:201 (+) Transcript_4496:587-1189(+)
MKRLSDTADPPQESGPEVTFTIFSHFSASDVATFSALLSRRERSVSAFMRTASACPRCFSSTLELFFVSRKARFATKCEMSSQSSHRNSPSSTGLRILVRDDKTQLLRLPSRSCSRICSFIWSNSSRTKDTSLEEMIILESTSNKFLLELLSRSIAATTSILARLVTPGPRSLSPISETVRKACLCRMFSFEAQFASSRC